MKIFSQDLKRHIQNHMNPVKNKKSSAKSNEEIVMTKSENVFYPSPPSISYTSQALPFNT